VLPETGNRDDLKKVAKAMRYQFRNYNLIVEALSHASEAATYQRLEVRTKISNQNIEIWFISFLEMPLLGCVWLSISLG